jgi:AcrR family transcriptional regulator
LLHHFPNKEALYTDVFEMLLSEWLEGLEAAMSSTTSGWDKAELVIRAGFELFAQTPDYVRIMRREALDSGVHVGVDLSGFLRPLFDKACAYFSEQMELGHFRRHNSQHLIITGYGAILTYFSDAPFIDELLDDEALTPENVQDHCDHVVAFFRAALIS